MSECFFYHYDIAYKTSKMDKFHLVEPPKYGWVADPFLVRYDGDLYLFAEIFLYKTERNGVIGYTKFKGNGFGEWTVTMDKHWHLSYPNVFVKDGKLYMCPEAYQSEEVSLYELVEFPNKWRKVKTYIDNVEYCDSTFLKIDESLYMFTFERGKNGSEGLGILCVVEDGKVKDRRPISNGLEGARPAGNILVENGRYIRVAQNCKPSYGSGLIFYEIEAFWPEYREHEIRRLSVKDIQPEWEDKYCGVHTYNKLDDMVVIDLKKKIFSDEEFKAQQRVRQVFMNKYS